MEEAVTEEMAAASNEHFSMEELSVALKGMKNGSCPGSDGLPAEVYKVFWSKIKDVYKSAIEQSYERSCLSDTMRRGILNLIPKGEKDTRFLKNLRPITLLNADYKILEKAVANRMTPALMALIHNDQTGFLPERRIAANIRKILDLISYSVENGEDNIVISCDYMKCFDRIEFIAVQKAMEYMNFSEKLRKWVEILYTDFRIKVQNCGYMSEEIKVSRGIHQGGPCSNALFLVVAELLAVELRGDDKIEAAFIYDIKQLLNQYADDMDVSTKNSEEAVNRVVKHISEFGSSTGFKLNYDKTTIYRVSAMETANPKQYTAGLWYTTQGINILGVEVTRNTEELIIKKL